MLINSAQEVAVVQLSYINCTSHTANFRLVKIYSYNLYIPNQLSVWCFGYKRNFLSEVSKPKETLDNKIIDKLGPLQGHHEWSQNCVSTQWGYNYYINTPKTTQDLHDHHYSQDSSIGCSNACIKQEKEKCLGTLW